MFNWFKRRKEVEETTPNKLSMFDNIQDELLDNPSFNLLIQCDQKTGNFIIAFDTEDLSAENLESAVILITQLMNGGCQDTLFEAILASADNDEKLKFCETLVEQCMNMNTYVNEVKIKTIAEELSKDNHINNKEKIDPTKIFNIKGSQNER